jgi:hypothetical protein
MRTDQASWRAETKQPKRIRAGRSKLSEFVDTKNNSRERIKLVGRQFDIH